MKNKDYIYLTIIIALVVIILWPKGKTIESDYTKLKEKNDSLLVEISNRNIKIDSLKSNIKTIYKIRTKTIIKYEVIYKNIDSLNSNSLMLEFNRKFADNNVK